MFSNFYGAINIPNTRNRGLKCYGEYVAISYYNTSNKKTERNNRFSLQVLGTERSKCVALARTP